MIPQRALRIAVYLLVADGLAALYLGGLLPLPGLGLVTVAVVVSWWQEALRGRFDQPWLGVTLVGVGGAALVAEIVTVSPGMLDVFTHLLVFLLLIKLYTRRTPRDARDIAFIAFFMLVAVSPVTTSVVFLGLFVVFLVVGTWLLMLRHMLSEADNATAEALPTRPVVVLRRDLFGLSLAASMATVAATAVLFVVIPRVGQPSLLMGAQAARMVSGFAERVQLGAFGEIELDGSVVMRVHVSRTTDDARPPALPALRWRGVAFDHFDGRTWTVGRRTLKLTLRRDLPVSFPVHQYYGGSVLTQEIYLEPMGTDLIFGASRVLRWHGQSDFITVDDLGNIAVPLPAGRLHYTVESELEPFDPRRVDIADTRVPRDPRWQARYTQLPPISARLRALARQIAGGSADDWEAARRLSAWLERELAYTRVLQTAGGPDPVDEFVFVHRRGNCEYFAAALAVMARSLGIPARVVNGFRRGEWNPYGRYFMVRLRDAHSWVEVFVDGAGWVSLDPSPRDVAAPAPAAAPAALWLDAVRMSWQRYVVGFSLHDQLAVADTVRRAGWSWSALLGPSPDRPALLRWAAAGVAVLAAALVVLGWRQRRHAGGTGRVPGFYARALRLLAQRGLTPAPGETAREFACRAQAAAWSAPLARLTGPYERVRFGGAALTAAEAAEVEVALAALAARRR
jgi:transglutaminase-like putative cysteine protease